LVIAMLLLDHLTLRGFQFQRGGPGEDGPLVGNRVHGNALTVLDQVLTWETGP
jgi:hypothetical protein